MKKNIAKDLLPHAIMLFVLDYAKRHELKITNSSGNLLLSRVKSDCDELFDESEA